MEKLIFTTEDNEEIEFYVLSDTRINGTNYILVTDSEDGDGEALILKDTAADSDTDSTYEIVDDDTELRAVADVFKDDLEDIGLEF